LELEVGRREGIVSGSERNGGRDGVELDVIGFRVRDLMRTSFVTGTDTGVGKTVLAARVPGAGGKFGLIAPLGRLFREGRLRRRRRRDWCVLNLAGKAHWAVMAVLQW
jgi:hypothetical protein